MTGYLRPERAAAPVLNSSLGNTTILSELKEFFLTRSVPAFLVGGYIRDSLRGISTRDIDVAVPCDPLAMTQELSMSFGGSVVPLGQARQASPLGAQGRRVVRLVLPYHDDGSWVIDVAGIEGSIHADQARRDFSVDAMALSLEDWCTPGWEECILDPFCGRGDLAQETIRAIGPWVFRDDPGRLIRAVRLAAKLGFRIEPRTVHLISRHAHLLPSTAGERVRNELLSILSLDGAKKHLETLDELGLLCCIIPELAIAKGVEQPREHYWDVFEHSLNAVEGVEKVTDVGAGHPVSGPVPWDEQMEGRFAQEVSDGHTRRTFLKLAALLHDVAKPQTKTVDAKGKTRFLGHHILGACMSREVLQRLRVGKRGVEMISGMVENHLRPMQMSQDGALASPRAVYRYFRDVGDVAIDVLYLSLADHLAARGPQLDTDGWRHHVKLITHILEVGTHQQSKEIMPRLITGHDLMGELGLSPGSLIGTLLEGVLDAQAAGEVGSRDEALAWARRRLGGPVD